MEMSIFLLYSFIILISIILFSSVIPNILTWVKWNYVNCVITLILSEYKPIFIIPLLKHFKPT